MQADKRDSQNGFEIINENGISAGSSANDKHRADIKPSPINA